MILKLDHYLSKFEMFAGKEEWGWEERVRNLLSMGVLVLLEYFEMMSYAPGIYLNRDIP